MKTELTINERQLILHRYPIRSNERLQAWSAGDEYLIQHIEAMAPAPQSNLLILNDHFGALSCWFAQNYNVSMMSDSYLAHQATSENLKRNQLPDLHLLTSLDPIPKTVDLVLMQLPRHHNYLKWQLHQLHTALPNNTPLIAVSKAQQIHNSTLALFEEHFGDTQTSLAWKKHRLIFSQLDASKSIPEVEPYTRWVLEDSQKIITNLPNVYSSENLDLGARFLLSQLTHQPQVEHIIDLGCGNGVLALHAALLNPQARITCVDESFMAIASAKANLTSYLPKEQDVHYIANNCLTGFKPNSADLILCNPPFHQQQAITDHIAYQMFKDAYRTLSSQGKLLVVGNRHLRYDLKLARLFGHSQVKLLATNPKFVILQATKP